MQTRKGEKVERKKRLKKKMKSNAYLKEDAIKKNM